MTTEKLNNVLMILAYFFLIVGFWISYKNLNKK